MRHLREKSEYLVAYEEETQPRRAREVNKMAIELQKHANRTHSTRPSPSMQDDEGKQEKSHSLPSFPQLEKPHLEIRLEMKVL